MYNCGPTVYDYAHIGNLRSFLFADLLRRYLEYSGLKVRQVMNITDVGHALADEDVGADKIEAAAEKEKMSPSGIARKYEKAFFEDIKKLKIIPAWEYPRASEHVAGMIGIIKKLFKNGYAYVGKDSSVYFDVSKFKKYGELSGNRLENLMAGARVEENFAKKNPYDFALWIINPKHLMQWNSPWGRGYPGWHIECSAMSMKYLGETLDIHTGGEDNKFPHHECEIAQSEGATGKHFARFWLHTKHLLVNGEKMSKSKGNFYILGDILEGEHKIPLNPPLIKGETEGDSIFPPLIKGETEGDSIFPPLIKGETEGDSIFPPLIKGETEGDFSRKGYSARAVRYLLLSAHYRDELNFTFESLRSAENTLARLDDFYTKLSDVSFKDKIKRLWQKPSNEAKKLIEESRKDFKEALDDDLNVAKALAAMFDFVKKANFVLEKGANAADVAEIKNLFLEFDKVFGLGVKKIAEAAIPKEIQELLKQRKDARKNKDWRKSDETRKEIEEKGYLVEDTAEGQKVKKK